MPESLTIVHGVDRDKTEVNGKKRGGFVMLGALGLSLGPLRPIAKRSLSMFDISHESDFSQPDSSSKTTGPTADSLQS